MSSVATAKDFAAVMRRFAAACCACPRDASAALAVAALAESGRLEWHAGPPGEPVELEWHRESVRVRLRNSREIAGEVLPGHAALDGALAAVEGATVRWIYGRALTVKGDFFHVYLRDDEVIGFVTDVVER
jgi:hypothetical protein